MSMSLTTQLRYEHDLLIGMAEALGAAARGDAPPADLPRLLLLLGQFTQLLQVHLLREDSVLYPALEASGDRVTAALAAAMREEHGALHRHIAAFDEAWTPEAIRRRWRDFGADIADLLDMVEQRIERENEDLYPLLAERTDLAA
ncbi:MAG TPA: hemerythrin domain-containing protein [Allosphingosinicella sp.]|jgi:hemerythrin-like domain-containing protein